MKTTRITESVNGGFPSYIQKQLDGPSPGHPGRHEALMKLALQMVGERIPDWVIFAELRAWIPDKDKTNSEINTLIKGAHAKNPQPASRGMGKSYSDYNQPYRTHPPEPKRTVQPV